MITGMPTSTPQTWVPSPRPIMLLYSAVPDIEIMLATMESAPGKTVLEIGPGLGANACLVAGKGANVIALDISQDRLVALRKRVASVSSPNAGKILPVLARAEALPFRDDALDGAFCRAVLIHTQLDTACAEVSRSLKPNAPVAFSEPMYHNPFVRLYRLTLAPREWKYITTYFTARQVEIVARHFSAFADQRFYLFSFLAFVFQYVIKSPVWFYAIFSRLNTLDSFLFRRLKFLRRYAWFTLMTGRKPRL